MVPNSSACAQTDLCAWERDEQVMLEERSGNLGMNETEKRSYSKNTSNLSTMTKCGDATDAITLIGLVAPLYDRFNE